MGVKEHVKRGSKFMANGNPKRTGGKKEEPSYEELEFIQESILQGLSDNEILVDMQKQPFLLRTAGFIKRRRKELDVAKKVIAKKAQGAYDTDTIERKKKHRDKLSEMTGIFVKALGEIHQATLGANYSLLEMGIENDDFRLLELLNDFHVKWMFSHMQADIPALENLVGWEDLKVKDITQELLRALSLRAERRDFQGKCEVCKDW